MQTDSPERKRWQRARKACYTCRNRKRKCAGLPPAACPNCQRDGFQCTWPEVDGRSTRPRKNASMSSGSLPPTVQLSELPKTSDSQRAPSWFTESVGSDTATGGAETLHNTYNWMLYDMDYLTGQAPAQVTAPMPDTQTASSSVPAYSQADAASSNQVSAPQSEYISYNSTMVNSQDLQREVERFMQPGWDSSAYNWLGDSPSVFFTLGNQMPHVETEEGDNSNMPLLSPIYDGRPPPRPPVKLSWWRPCGRTAIEPGLKKWTLKVHLDKLSARRATAISSTAATATLIDEDGYPDQAIMLHLIDIFEMHFCCQFPAIEHTRVKADVQQRRGSIFLLNCIAATASRFSEHPALALPSLQPHGYGSVFVKTARQLLGTILSVPSRDTVNALALLAGLSHGADDESEEWLYAGMAARMAIDLGLHLDPGEEAGISEEERRLNCLTFWSVCILDFSLSFGVGRQTAIRPESVTQRLPMQEDIYIHGAPQGGARSMFPLAAKLMLSYGPGINMLNRPHEPKADQTIGREVHAEIQKSLAIYSELPSDMLWNAQNLQEKSASGNASIYVQSHLWMHCILASSYLTETDLKRNGKQSGTATPTAFPAASTSRYWQNSARTIGEILVLADVINPFAYHALPFVNQAFFVAGACYIKEAEQDDDAARAKPDEQQAEFIQSLKKTVAANNISTLKAGLEKQSQYWSGVAWVSAALSERLSGVKAGAIDLSAITEKLPSFVTISDNGLIRS